MIGLAYIFLPLSLGLELSQSVDISEWKNKDREREKRKVAKGCHSTIGNLFKRQKDEWILHA